MPQSRNRPGHKYEKPSAIPASQRTHATTICAILFTFFAAIIAFFSSDDYGVIALASGIGAVIGYVVGKAMEKDAK